MTGLFQQLDALVRAPGVSGRETAIAKLVANYYRPLCDELIYDNLGSIYGVKYGSDPQAPKVMVSGHLDEAGFLVRKIQENGLIQGLLLGKVLSNSLLGQEVCLVNEANQLFNGSILAWDEANQVLRDQVVIMDFGFSSAKEVEQAQITLGQGITFAPECKIIGSQQHWLASNWNGRIGVSQTIDLLRRVDEAEGSLPFHLYVGCTVQEQVGLRGAQTAANLVEPDLAILLDTNQAWDYQKDVSDAQGVLGQGVLLTYYDTSVLPNPLPIRMLKKICEKQGYPYQYYYSMEDSDGGWFNKLRTGCPVLFCNQAVWNLHTPKQIASAKDYQTIGQALFDFIQELQPQDITRFKEENR